MNKNIDVSEETTKEYNRLSKVFFWMAWIFGLVLIATYVILFLFEVSTLFRDARLGLFIAIMIGLGVLVAQVYLVIESLRLFKRREVLSKILLSLIGGSILLAFVWTGGCFVALSNMRLAG